MTYAARKSRWRFHEHLDGVEQRFFQPVHELEQFAGETI